MAAHNVLSQNGFLMVNRSIAKAYGLAAAAVLGDLCTRMEQHGEEFWATNEQLMDSCALGLKAIRSSIAALEDAGFISTEMRGVPQKRYFRIDDNAIAEFLLKTSDSPKTPDSPEGGTGAPFQGRLMDVPAKETRHRHGRYGHVMLTDSDLASLEAELGKDTVAAIIERMDGYCEESGKTYKNYAAAVRNWAKRDTARNAPQSRPDARKGPVPAQAPETVREDAEKAVKAVVDVLRFNWHGMVEGSPFVEPETGALELGYAASLLDRGFTVTDMRHAAVGQMAAWGGDAKMTAFLRPSTILKPDKFGGYLAAAPGNVIAFRTGYDAESSRNLYKDMQSPRERYVGSDKWPLGIIEAYQRKAASGLVPDIEKGVREFCERGGVEMKHSAWIRKAQGLKGGFEEVM